MGGGRRRSHHPSLERIRELFLYDPVTGVFRAKVKRSQIAAGEVVGSPSKKGYLRVWIDGELWYLHDIAWLLIYEEWPPDDLDHQDTNPANNAIGNLRPCDRSHNNANWRLPRTNTSGFKGVVWIERLSKWKAQIQFKRKNIYLGLHDTPEAAYEAYLEAARKYFGEFTRGA
jgi:AP2 domain/HNH endonuclease